MKKHPLPTRIRAFRIWQRFGTFLWGKARERKVREGKRGDGAFYRGAFDSIPFLNDDAKRTFSHLLLRPGYMMKDYLRGDHERYLAPLTSLIIFYAFFALVSAVLQPVQRQDLDPFREVVAAEDIEIDAPGDMKALVQNAFYLIQRGYIYLNLDRYPGAVHTRGESALAALEGTLRSQGIPLFIGQFFLLWLAISLSLRRFRLGMSATAAVSAYILCQFSFFMLFAVLLSFGESKSISGLLMLVLLTVDFHQLLDVDWKKGARLAVKTGLWFAFFFVAVLLLVSVLVVLLAWMKGA